VTEYSYLWMRVRTKHASGLGEWQFREIAVPSTLTKKKQSAELTEYIVEEIVPDIAYELSTDSEYWRGIDWELAPLPRHFMANRIKGLKQQIKNLRVKIKRYEEQLPKLPEQTRVEGNKQRCRQFPSCGCIKQFKTKDCREPNEYELKHLLWQDAQRAKKG